MFSRSQKAGKQAPTFFYFSRDVFFPRLKKEKKKSFVCKECNHDSYFVILLFSFRHYPKTSFTIVTDTPENLRLKQQSMLNSQVSPAQITHLCASSLCLMSPAEILVLSFPLCLSPAIGSVSQQETKGQR